MWEQGNRSESVFLRYVMENKSFFYGQNLQVNKKCNVFCHIPVPVYVEIPGTTLMGFLNNVVHLLTVIVAAFV